MKRVFICSPYRGDVERNLKAARKHARMAAIIGYCPLAPHLMFPQFLNDNDPEQRILGITLGVEQMKVCDEIWIFGGRISNGMAFELEKAKELLESGYKGSIREVAAMVGYDDVYHFSKLFKKHYGVSPSKIGKEQ